MHTLMQKGNFTFTFSTVSKRWTVRVSYCESGVERWHPWNVRFIRLPRCFNLEHNCSIIGGINNLRQLNYPISLSWSQIWVFFPFNLWIPEKHIVFSVNFENVLPLLKSFFVEISEITSLLCHEFQEKLSCLRLTQYQDWLKLIENHWRWLSPQECWLHCNCKSLIYTNES